MTEPPVSEYHLQNQEADTDQQAVSRAAYFMQFKSVSIVQKTADYGLGDIVGQTHLSVRSKDALDSALIDPIEQQKSRHHRKHEKQIVP